MHVPSLARTYWASFFLEISKQSVLKTIALRCLITIWKYSGRFEARYSLLLSVNASQNWNIIIYFTLAEKMNEVTKLV